MRTVGTYRNWYCPVAFCPQRNLWARLAGLRLAGHDGGCRIGDRGRAAFRMRVGDGACSCRRTVRSAYVLPVGAGQRRSDVRVLPVAGRYDEVRRRRDRQRGGEARLVRAGFRGVVVVRDADGDRCRCVEYVGGPSRIGRVDASGMRTDSPFGRIAPLGRNVERRSRPNRKGEDVRGALRMLYGRERSAYDGLLSGRTALFQCDGESGNGQRRQRRRADRLYRGTTGAGIRTAVGGFARRVCPRRGRR